MRIARLDLLAYGPFRGHTLDLSAPGLHVVLGRNEAGKSTTLRAITGLLYGIDVRTTDAHVHKTTELRIGGVLEGAGGERLRIVRRKGSANTLLNEREQPLDESVLKKLLAGVSKESFIHAFGLTHEALAAGAQALLEGKGDLGESLFDASVGGGGEVQRVLAELKAEAERIYKPRGTTLPLNDALKAFAEAQKDVREKESKPEAFLQQERGLEQEVADRESRVKTREDLVTRRARLERARRRSPIERRRDRALEKRTELGLSAEHVQRLEVLKDRFAAYKHAVEQRSTFIAEAERLAERVTEAVRRAGLEGEKNTESLRLDARKEARIHALLRERTKLLAEIASGRTEIARQERELGRLNETAAAPEGSPAPGADLEGIQLAAALERARNLGDIESRLATKKAQLERRRTELHARAIADGLFSGSLETFVSLRVPAASSINHLEARFLEYEHGLARTTERLVDLDREAASIEKQIAGHAGDFAPPDAAALQAARAARDAAWRSLHEASASTRRSLEIEVERLLREADALADRMIHEADRVTVLARLRSEAETNARQMEKAQREKTEALVARAALDGELRGLFADAGVAPPHPAAFGEMRDWLTRHAKISEDFANLRDHEAEVSGDEQTTEGARQDLVTALGSTELSARRLVDLISLGAQRVAAIESSRHAAAEAARATVKIRLDLDDRLAARKRDEGELEEVTNKLAELITPLGVPLDASADEVNRSIEALRELFSLADKRADVESRARGFDSTIREFEADLARAIKELAPDLASLEMRDSAPMLFSRASDANENAQELERATRELEAEGDVVLDEDDRVLVKDVDATERALEELGEQIEEADRDIALHAERIGGLRSGLDRMRGESNAAEALARAQLHLASVREQAERWCRVRLAAHVLSREIERYREENQGPLLSSSSALFSRLTLGSFSGIKAGFDDKDRPTLRCVRPPPFGDVAAPPATEVDVAGLSDGTRDQLYLSLRLASLLRRADVAEPMPLVLDDVLIQLDDQRAAAALTLLAEVSRKMQVLFFTHHARLVDIARSAVPAGELVVHELVSGPYVKESATAPA